MEGMCVIQGTSLKPPFVVRHELDKIFVNNVQVYPPVEVEGRRDLVEFGIRDILSATLKASTMEKLREVENALDEYSTAKKLSWTEHRGISFSQKTQDIQSFLEGKGLKAEISSTFHHVLVPVDENFGVVALFNEEAVIQETRKSLEEGKAKRVLEYDTSKLVSECIESNLMEGNFLRFENNVIELIPKKALNAMGQELEAAEGGSWSALGHDEKVEKVMEIMAEPTARTQNSAAIFFPHRSWQKEAIGKASAYWIVLANKLIAEDYAVKVYLDTAVTLNVWAQVLSTGAAQNLQVIYNLGHGDDNLIAVGEPKLKENWLYFNNEFVNQYSKLKGTLVYVHNCATMSDLKLAQAFVGKGACAYVGWKHTTSADADYCDKVDSLFWTAMIDLNSTVTYAKNQIATIDTDVAGYGNQSCRLPPRSQDLNIWLCRKSI